MSEQVATALLLAVMVGGGLGLAVWAALAGHAGYAELSRTTDWAAHRRAARRRRPTWADED